MEIHKFKKLESEVKKKDFSAGYSGLNTLMKGLSILGNMGSIFAASFFMMKLMGGLITNSIVVILVSFIFLISLELIKRIIFDKFSLEFIRTKYNLLKREVFILMFFSIGIICASFYSSLNGAKVFSDRNDEIEDIINSDISTYSDSLKINIYLPKVEELEMEITDIKKNEKLKDNEVTKLNAKLEDRGWLSIAEKTRIKDLKDEIVYIREQIVTKEDKIKSLYTELDDKVEIYESSLNNDGASNKEKNKTNSIIFVIISTIIEFTILIGIFFSKYYSYTSYNDIRRKMDKDPRYQKWVLYNEMLDIVYMNDAIIGDKLPTQKDILEFSKMNNIYIGKYELVEFLKLLGALKIIKTSSVYKFINKEKEEAEDILTQYFKI